MTKTLASLGLALTLVAGAAAALADEAPFRLSVVETGMRDYYCTVTVRLENRGAQVVDDVNGHFVLYSGEDEVGEGRSASFLGVAAGGEGEAVFLAPNAPCDTIDGYAFRVGACRIAGSFENRAECASWFEADTPIRDVAGR